MNLITKYKFIYFKDKLGVNTLDEFLLWHLILIDIELKIKLNAVTKTFILFIWYNRLCFDQQKWLIFLLNILTKLSSSVNFYCNLLILLRYEIGINLKCLRNYETIKANCSTKIIRSNVVVLLFFSRESLDYNGHHFYLEIEIRKSEESTPSLTRFRFTIQQNLLYYSTPCNLFLP